MLTAIGLSKHQPLDADPDALQEINFTGNLECAGNIVMFFIMEEVKEAILNFSQETIKS